MMFDYFDSMENGIEYLIALGSIVGVLGLVVCFVFLLVGTKRLRMSLISVMILCIALISLCGLYTGFNYFHLNI
ncbi:MAG: hypothetical protein JW891_06265 [Candidatus Lokiarchaeota archaeon]|nr:hypothetical protein [Candidatus Lokiarchaeota archaeon]